MFANAPAPALTYNTMDTTPSAHRAVMPCMQRIDYRPQSCTTACSLVPTGRLLTMLLTARCRWDSCPKQGNVPVDSQAAGELALQELLCPACATWHQPATATPPAKALSHAGALLGGWLSRPQCLQTPCTGPSAACATLLASRTGQSLDVMQGSVTILSPPC